jgi:diacylglycerol kinase family enzyme
VYSQTLGYPRHAADAAHALLGALEHRSLRRVGVGLADDRPFLFCAGIGFDAAVIRRVERHSRSVKRLASHPLHIAAAVHTFFSSEGRRTHAHIDVEDGPQLSDVRFAIVSKATPYTHLGRLPLNISRNANIDTRLSLAAFTALRALTLVGGAASSIRTGAFLAKRKDVVALDDLAKIHVYADEPFPYQVDGDDAGDTSELNIAFAADALAVAIPKP